MMKMLHLQAKPVIAILLFAGNVAAFTPPTPFIQRTFTELSPLGKVFGPPNCRRFPSYHVIKAQNGNNDDDYDDDDDEEDGLDNLLGKKLGINIGAELPSLSPEEIEEIRIQAQATLDKAIDGRLADIEALRDQMQQDLAKSRERMQTASQLNAQLAKQNLLEKIDRLSDEFLSSTSDFREGTKLAAAADKMAASTGRGVDWGSWGTVGGLDVVLGSSESDKLRPSKLLGSVDSARRRGQRTAEKDEETHGEDQVPVDLERDNRILVVFDGKQVSVIESI